MLFVKTDDLKSGMRLAKPIYNKSGVMLYERNSKLTSQGVVSIKNFGLIGVYVLEPAEPVPPMSEDDIEFERFQAVSVFTIRDILDAVCKRAEPKNLYQFANQIIKNYGSLHHKINYIQNLRSNEDYVYKHSLNTAILAAMIFHRMDMEFKKQLDVVVAAILHDVGSQLIPMALRGKKKDELTEDDMRKINTYHVAAYQLFSNDYSLDPDIKRNLTMLMRFNYPDIIGSGTLEAAGKIPSVEVLKTAYTFDNMTAMKLDEEPLSEISAIKHLLSEKETYSEEVVNALIQSINILQPGVCVELTNGDKGLVVAEGAVNVLEPFVLSFRDNQLYNLGDKYVAQEIQIKDIMKTMDNRHVVDCSLLEEYRGKNIEINTEE